MKTHILIILLLLSPFIVVAQIYDCYSCDKEKLKAEDLKDISLLELKTLRNEIFARHQYSFKNTDITDFFKNKYEWYSPKKNTKVILNEFEKYNVNLFLTLEKKKTKRRSIIIKELKLLMQNSKASNTVYIESVFNTVNGYGSSDYNQICKNLNTYFFKYLNPKNINWYNETAILSNKIDNGQTVFEVSISIHKNKVSLKYQDLSYSSIMHAETKIDIIGNTYEGIPNEYLYEIVFELVAGKLIAKAINAAG